jgi:WD40 repeat protein
MSGGQTFATGGSDGTVKLWKSDGTPISTIQTNQGTIVSIGSTSDGQTLATGGSDGTVKLWPIDTNLDTLLDKGCNWLNVYFIGKPKELLKLHTCQTSDRTLAAAPNLVEDSDKLAKEGKTAEAITGYKTAKLWDNRLTFDPATRAAEKAPKKP